MTKTPDDQGPSAGDGERRRKKTSAASSSRDEVTVNTGDQERESETRWDGKATPGSGRTSAMDAPTPASSGFGESSPGAAQPYARSMDPAVRGAAGPSTGRKPPRKAHLQVARFEPWSVMKFSFIMSLVSFLVLFVAVAVLYLILSVLGVFDALSGTIHDLTSNDQGRAVNSGSWFSAARVLGYTALIGTLNVLFITALATVWSVIYNMAADLVGGVEVTLKEAD